MSDSPVLEAARASGLIRPAEPLLVMLSGGADSTCLLDVAVAIGAQVSALHVNHGLRGAESEADEQHCRELCDRVDVPLTVRHVALPETGNLQALARDARYAAAQEACESDYATAHTATDQVETILYRLAASPGRRALLGMAARRGRLVRPLLQVSAATVREHCRGRGLAWREDTSNADPRFARARVRRSLVPALQAVTPAAERSVLETAGVLRDEAAVLDVAVAEALEALGGGPAVELEALVRLPVALARLVVRDLVERSSDDPPGVSRDVVDRILSLGREGSRAIDLGGGLTAVSEYGVLRIRRADPAPDAAIVRRLALPGRVDFGDWLVEAEEGGGGEVVLARARLPATLTVRSWREGDRIRPKGLGGTKTLQDLFTDRKVPRALRRQLPVVEADGEIAWVAGVAVGESFAADPEDGDVISLRAQPVTAQGPANRRRG